MSLYQFCYALTSQTLVFQGRTPEINYRYTYKAFFTDNRSKDKNWILKDFGMISNRIIDEIFECQEVSNIEVSIDNITNLYTLRFCSPKDLDRTYTGEMKVDDTLNKFYLKKSK